MSTMNLWANVFLKFLMRFNLFSYLSNKLIFLRMINRILKTQMMLQKTSKISKIISNSSLNDLLNPKDDNIQR
jgi:hypothetical protein